MARKQRWSYEDDYLCCERYLYFSIGRTRALSIYALIEELAEHLPHLSRGSLRMKLQNIKAISQEMRLNDGVDISPLDQYSAQCRRAFINAFNDMAKKFNRDDADETPDERDKNINEKIDKGGKIILSEDYDDVFDEYGIFRSSPHLLVGQKVFHKQFGMGKISAIDGRSMSVEFDNRTSKFVFPDAFNAFISFYDSRLQRKMKEYLEVLKFNIVY